MKSKLLLIAGALLTLCSFASAQAKKKPARNAPAAAAAPVAAPVKETGYGLYRMVRLRNIFDPDRRPPPPEGVNKAALPPPAPVARNSYLVLTGTMVTEGKRLAFFSGSQREFNRVVTAHEKVGDCEVAAISTGYVDLKRGEQAIVLPVGKQLTLGEKPVVVAAAPETPSSDAPPPASAPAPSQPTAEVGAPVDTNAVMRRLMERRQRENK